MNVKKFTRPLFVRYVNFRSRYLIIIFITVSIESNWQAQNSICENQDGLLIMRARPSVCTDIINVCEPLCDCDLTVLADVHVCDHVRSM